MSAWIAISLSVAMHVCWNLLVRSQGRDTRLLIWALAVHCLTLGPWGLYALSTEVQWNWTLVGLLGVSSTANVLYFIGLDRAYQHAPAALVYPLVRSSPLMIGLWSWLLFGESLGGLSWMAMGVSVIGLLILASTAWGNADRHALPWGAVAMLATSIYSISDREATAYLPSISSVLGFITVGYACSLLALLMSHRGPSGRWLPPRRPAIPVMLLAGIFIGLAYVLVIHAMRSLPAAIVVAFSNAGILLAGLSSIVIFHERQHWQGRLVGMVLISAGLIMLVVSRT